MGKKEAFSKMSEALQEGDADALVSALNEVLNDTEPLELIHDGMMTGLKKDYLKNALSDPPEKVGDRGAAVLQAVLNWVDALKKEGVKDPQPPK